MGRLTELSNRDAAWDSVRPQTHDQDPLMKFEGEMLTSAGKKII